MTIGVGLVCPNAVVLCSDRQITTDTGNKYEQGKLLWAGSFDDFTMTFGYAGDPDAAATMFELAKESIRLAIAKSKGEFHEKHAKAVLRKTFRTRCAKGLQTLIGLSVQGNPPAFLLTTRDDKVVDRNAQCIGFGDSSALKYLCSFLLPTSLEKDEARVIGSYLVSVANRYVDGCSGGPDWSVLNQNGTVVEGKGVFTHQEERFIYCEEEIGNQLRHLLFRGGKP